MSAKKQEKTKIQKIEKTTLRKMFLSATGFKNIFQSLYKTVEQLDDYVIFSEYNYYFDMLTVNASFSCEVYLKLLYAYDYINEECNTLGGHNLKRIYNSLPKETKELIFKNINLSKETFYDGLSIMSNDFEEFRYSYEYPYALKVLNYSFYNNLLNVLQPICEKIIKEVD